MQKYTKELLKVLTEAGWSLDRQLNEENLVFTEDKRIFAQFLSIAKEFGQLELHFEEKESGDRDVMYFDLDESESSRMMRARIFGYADYRNISLIEEPDFKLQEDFELTQEVEGYIGEPCARVGFLDDEFGFEVYVINDGSIYWTHSGVPAKVCESLPVFLENLAAGKKMYT
ncbi:SUKH-3 domain-containing protein [Aliikangiella coralliicola]|uniref:SMI1/KNR4 family protein n=1 Tax=Aliikangiella coralliicola TaxID=2592383 RepID=A0A545UA47_9GAMM|nr:SUKH-3 domain-containing protein [Aliikangiella coralliicola]TQV86342.1 hypothetical protein FLL46_15575 [Aliikangiella coralliicola]